MTVTSQIQLTPAQTKRLVEFLQVEDGTESTVTIHKFGGDWVDVDIRLNKDGGQKSGQFRIMHDGFMVRIPAIGHSA